MNDGNGANNITAADTIAGGAGNDVLELGSDGTTIADAAFTNLTSIDDYRNYWPRITGLTLGSLQQLQVLPQPFHDNTAQDLATAGAGRKQWTVNLDADDTLNTVNAAAYTVSPLLLKLMNLIQLQLR